MNVSGRKTRDLYRKCSGEESRSERRTSVRSTFDKAVCSEPLAFAADAGLWGLNGRDGLGGGWKREGSVEIACETRHRSTSTSVAESIKRITKSHFSG